LTTKLQHIRLYLFAAGADSRPRCQAACFLTQSALGPSGFDQLPTGQKGTAEVHGLELTKVASNVTIALVSRALEEVAREAIELSQEERLVLARILLEGCDLPGYPINEAEQTWEEEIADRIRAVDSGSAKARSWEDVLGDINRRLAG